MRIALALLVTAAAPLRGLAAGRQDPTPVWTGFVEARAEGLELPVPDFSHAGYRRGEEPLPAVEYPVLDVTDFGALPDDGESDRDALQRAFDAAAVRAPVVIRFPPGRFQLGDPEGPPPEPLRLAASRVVLRGSGAGIDGGPATELFLPRNLEALVPENKWTTPYVIQLGASGSLTKLTEVTGAAERESRELAVRDSSGLEPGDWIALRSRDPAANQSHVAPFAIEPEWTRMIEDGVEIVERHRVAAVAPGRVTLAEPVRVPVDPAHGWVLYATEVVEGIGVEDLAFVGNWKRPFVHHLDDVHDGGWSLLRLSGCVDSWIRRCRFTDVNRPWVLSRCANVSVLDSVTDGNGGHHATGLAECTNCLVAFYEDRAGHWHGPGVQARSSGNVFHRTGWTATTCFEAHASYPVANLFDRCTGALLYGRWGGDRRALPNHLRYLVFWNFEQVGRPIEDYTFWRERERGVHGRVMPPILVGWHGPSCAETSFDTNTVELLEGYGEVVLPASLWLAQLELRLGELPAWLAERR